LGSNCQRLVVEGLKIQRINGSEKYFDKRLEAKHTDLRNQKNTCELRPITNNREYKLCVVFDQIIELKCHSNKKS